MITWIAAIVAGITILAKGADYFVESASAIAQRLKIHPMIVGVVVLGFATAMPEMVVSAIAAWHHQLGMSVGNAVGSSIANLGLVLGGTALVVPLTVSPSTLRFEVPAVFLSMGLVTILVWDQVLSFSDGVIIAVGFLVTIMWINLSILRRPPEETPAKLSPEIAIAPTQRIVLCFVVGLIAMFLGSHFMVLGAKGIAHAFGISDFIIGLTIVAVGTSLPELAASIVAAYRGQHDIALGNVLGSNLFNMLAVMAMPALIMPGKMPETLLHRDIPVMFAFTVLMLVLCYRPNNPCHISRASGAILLAAFLAYSVGLFFFAS